MRKTQFKNLNFFNDISLEHKEKKTPIEFRGEEKRSNVTDRQT